MANTLKIKKSKQDFSSKMKIDYKIPLYDYHPNHDQHMCSIAQARNMKTVAALSKDAKYICFLCGRAAKKKEHLCEPVAI
jgi:hypothetical protein